MIFNKNIPLFNFINPNIRVINIGDVRIINEPRILVNRRLINTIWTPGLNDDFLSIEQEILRDLTNNQRFYQQNNLNDTLNRWGRLIQPILNENDLLVTQQCNNTLLPLNELISPIILPNDEGWYADNMFESLMIKMEIKPYQFLKRIRRIDLRSMF